MTVFQPIYLNTGVFCTNMRIFIITSLLLLAFIPVYAQNAAETDYASYYNRGDYEKALEIIRAKLTEIYDKRVDNKRVPMEIISFKKAEKEAEEAGNINYLFTIRKAEGFFIEDNSELSALHLAAARCLVKIPEFDTALNHYYQSLRFKQVEYKKDDAIYYEISRIYKAAGHFNAYVNTLESACTLNPDNYDYSLELGSALQPTREKKRAIYHLERYIKSKGDNLENPDLYIKLGNLYEDIGRYLETAEYYKKYLQQKENDGYIHFALGYLAFAHIGDYELAVSCFEKALSILPENEIFRRSKAHEISGDIRMNELEFEDAISSYLSTVKYQDSMLREIKDKEAKIKALTTRIRDVKSSIIKERGRAFEKYNEYEYLEEEKGKIELENREKKYQMAKLNIGKTRWNIAESYEKLEKLEDAIKYYREAISFNYKSNESRKKIVKLQLKIKRGY